MRTVEAFCLIKAAVISAKLSDDINVLNHNLTGSLSSIPEVFFECAGNATFIPIQPNLCCHKSSTFLSLGHGIRPTLW